MAGAEHESVENGAAPLGAFDRATLGSILQRVRTQAAADPFSNPILLFALDMSLRIDRGELDLEELDSLVQRLTMEGYADRAQRLANYLGTTDIAANEQAITALIEKKAGECSFEEFRAALSRSLFGVVFTAHPTFSIT